MEAFAAEELREHIQKITNVSVPVAKESQKDKKLPVKIYIGKSFAGKFSEDLKALKGNDGFAVRSKGNHIYIFGDIPKGTLNGVYSFLEENTDIIWARAQSYGTIFTPAKTLRLVRNNYRMIPVNNLRGWQITSYPYNKETELWNIRMACNKNPTQYGKKDSYNRSLDGGMVMMPLFGHNLRRFMTKNDFKLHPEYFALCGGIRRPAGEAQLCFSNMDGADHFAKNAVSAALVSRHFPGLHFIVFLKGFEIIVISSSYIPIITAIILPLIPGAITLMPKNAPHSIR